MKYAILDGKLTHISKVKKGDYVFIQFGHNDEKADSTRHTDPGSTFDENLRRYVNETIGNI